MNMGGMVGMMLGMLLWLIVLIVIVVLVTVWALNRMRSRQGPSNYSPPAQPVANSPPPMAAAPTLTPVRSPTSGTTAPSPRSVFKPEGEYWTLEYQGRVTRLRDRSGLRYIATLLANPNREILALDLVNGPTLQPAGNGSKDGDLTASSVQEVVPLLDDRAKAAYRARLDELEGELSEAERFNDPERASRARAERDAVTRELARAVGLGGRDRPSGSPAERARISVTKSIKAALNSIATASPALGTYLESTIRTGTYCSYLPDPHAPIDWEF